MSTKELYSEVPNDLPVEQQAKLREQQHGRILELYESKLARTPKAFLHTLQIGTDLYQISEYEMENGVPYYNRSSDSRYGDPSHEIGVSYFASSPSLAVAETCKAQPDDMTELKRKKLYRFKACRELIILDVTASMTAFATPVHALTRPSNDSTYGYEFTQRFTRLALELMPEIDGFSYRSAVYDSSTAAASNVVLFSDRERQVASVSAGIPLDILELDNGESVVEFLELRSVTF